MKEGDVIEVYETRQVERTDLDGLRRTTAARRPPAEPAEESWAWAPATSASSRSSSTSPRTTR